MGFQLREEKGIKYFVVEEFVKTGLVVHGFSTRQGGISKDAFKELNMAFPPPDLPENVRENRRRFCEVIGIDYHKLIFPQQTHSDHVQVVTEMDTGRGALDYESGFPDTDALITNCPQVPLGTCYADCVPLFFLDPVKKVVAVCHAGWKGTMNKIGTKTLRMMQDTFGTEPRSCLVAIAPSIGPCCYEVDLPVVEKVQQSFCYWEELLRETGEQKWKLNLWEANRLPLLEAGVPAENIIMSGLCTVCHPHLFFSHRRDHGLSGRMAAVIMLKE